MSWNPHMEVHYADASYPYNSAGSFIEYFEGLTYQHVNFIFDSGSHTQTGWQQNPYSLMSSNFYKFGMSPHRSTHYDYSHTYEVHNHVPQSDEYRRPLQNASVMSNEHNTAVDMECERIENPTIQRNPIVECPRRHHSSHDYQVFWQDNVDPDAMSYEELLELSEAVGTQSRGLSQELISFLPVSKYKRSFFSRRKSKSERCVICQMEYKRGDRRITLPCKHIYHASCGTKWLSINKACPICYMEVFGEMSNVEMKQ